MSGSAQRKRTIAGSPAESRPVTKTSRAANNRKTANINRSTNVGRATSRSNKAANSATNNTANRTANVSRLPDEPAEMIDVMDHFEDGVQEVVDLTCEGSETAVVDLTNNDSVLLMDEGPQNMRTTAGESYVVSSGDEEDTPTAVHATETLSLHSNSTSRSAPGTISCPVCLDSYSEIVESGRLVVSTKCGHVFCSQCLRDALTTSHTCPTCRKKLTHRQYHPLYV